MKPVPLFLLLSLCSLPALADLDINRASQAELERLRGVGPQLSARILAAREGRPFSDWEDLRDRVTGLGPVQSARLSKEGLTVAGTAFAATDSMLTPLKSTGRPVTSEASQPQRPPRQPPAR
jgi:competence protein ComEA